MDKKTFDITRHDTRPAAEEGRWLTLKDPFTGEPTPMRILLRGVDSAAYKAKMNEQREKRLDRLAELAKSGVHRLPAAYVDEEGIERIVAVTVKWEGIARGADEWVFSPEAAKEFYTGWPDYAEQVFGFLGARANFLPASAKA